MLLSSLFRCNMGDAAPAAQLKGHKGGALVSSNGRPPYPPFTREEALVKVRAAEDAWNSQDPQKISLAYTADSQWRNRDKFVRGRDEIIKFLIGKWERETEYRLIKELVVHSGNCIAVRFQYEYKDANTGQWYRAYGNENWEFAETGEMRNRQASINEVAIDEKDRRFTWPKLGPRPADFPGLTELEEKFGFQASSRISL